MAKKKKTKKASGKRASASGIKSTKTKRAAYKKAKAKVSVQSR
jgi:hypothetical protein